MFFDNAFNPEIACIRGWRQMIEQACTVLPS